jgi:hypothetical protein
MKIVFADLKYKGINQVMKYMRHQIYEGVPFCVDVFNIEDPETLYNTLNTLFIYKDDPQDVELIMSPQTFVENNYWGRAFTGDCDDIVTFVTSYCVAHGIKCQIALVGRKRSAPTHIFNYVLYNGKMIPFDLTNRVFNYERDGYKYKQILNVN